MAVSGLQCFPSMAVVVAIVVPMSPEPPKAPKPSLEMVFEAEETPLLRYAFGLVGRREVAEDLVQDAFLRLHQHWDEVRQPRAWLFRCVRNRAYNHIRDNKRETLADPATQESIGDGDATNPGGDGGMGAGRKDMGREASDDVLGKMEAAGILHMLMGDLDERDQLLLRLKYFEGLNYKQISQRSGMSVGNVGYRLHYTLKDLADSLRRAGVEGAKG